MKPSNLSISFEFFPPKTEENIDALMGTISQISECCDPSFISVTYGAGGSTREFTKNVVKRIITETSLTPVPHLTCVLHSKEKIENILEEYTKDGVSNIMALRGDVPASHKERENFDWNAQDFPHAKDLISFIKEFEEKTGNQFNIGVAGFPHGHPEMPNRLKEIRFLKEKVDAGSDYICTQLFFENPTFFDYVDRCRLHGINIPIIAGIMPISSMKNVEKMADLASNVNFPVELQKNLIRFQNCPKSLKKFAVEFTTNQCLNLLDQGVDGIHFYTLNKSEMICDILNSLALPHRKENH